jgi:hypothetical protein
MTRRRPLPPDLIESPFARRDAVDIGIPDRRLRAGDLTAPHRGVRQSLDTPDDVFWRARSYLPVMPAGGAFSHATAARLYDLPVPLYLDELLHVSVRAGRRPPERPHVVGHQVHSELWAVRELVHRDFERSDLFVLPLCEPALAWAQLAVSVDHDDLVGIADAAVSVVNDEPPVATLSELAAVVRAWRGRRGAGALRWALPRVRTTSRSRTESLFRLMEARAGIPEPRQNAQVFDREGRLLGTPDQSWPEYRVLLEYEGDGHRSRARFRSDITRYETFADGGWAVMRVHGDDVFDDPNPALNRLARRLMGGGWRPRRGELRRVSSARR